MSRSISIYACVSHIERGYKIILFTPREILALVLKEIISIILDICQLILFKQIFLMGKKVVFVLLNFLS